jgi:hypothetical protein
MRGAPIHRITLLFVLLDERFRTVVGVPSSSFALKKIISRWKFF